WSSDGKRIFFSSPRQSGSIPNVFAQSSDGTGEVERLTESPNTQYTQSVSPDGKYVLLRETRPTTGQDIAMLSIADRKVIALIHSPFNEQNPEVSPDGRWVAYESAESGQVQIYVRPFPAVDTGRWQVSTGGGTRASWARNGRELFYATGTDSQLRLM